MRNSSKNWLIGLSFLVLGIAVGLGLRDQLRANEWGELIGGTASGLALVFVFLGLLFQSKELRLQRRELKLQRNELKRSSDALEVQSKEIEISNVISKNTAMVNVCSVYERILCDISELLYENGVRKYQLTTMNPKIFRDRYAAGNKLIFINIANNIFPNQSVLLKNEYRENDDFRRYVVSYIAVYEALYSFLQELEISSANNLVQFYELGQIGELAGHLKELAA